MKHADPNSLTITLPADQMERLDEAVQSGEYASKHEVVLAALRLWEERNVVASIDDEYLKQEYEAGLASGEPVPVSVPEVVVGFRMAKHAKG